MIRPSPVLLRRLLVIAAVFSMSYVPSSALCGEPAAAGARDASAAADELAKRAVDALKRDAPAEAETHAREAWKLKRSYDIASNLGLAELALKKHREAAEHLAYALRFFPSNGKPEHKRLIEVSFAKARAEVAALTVRVAPDGAEIWIDGARIGTSPLLEAVFVDPGTRSVEARREGHLPATHAVSAVKGGAAELAISLQREPPPAPTTSAGASATATPSPTPGPRVEIVIGGAAFAGAALIAGGVLFGVAESARGELRADTPKNADGSMVCAKEPAPGRVDPACEDLRSRMRTGNALGQAGIGLLVAGAALGFATIGYAIVPRRAQPAPAVSVLPVVGPAGGGLSCVGSF